MNAPAQSSGKVLAPGETGTVLIADLDTKSVITRDLSDVERSRQAIEDYAAAYREGAKLPPITVFLVAGCMVVVDGDHRVHARALNGDLGIVATCVGSGSLDDALRYALQSTNHGHGLRLSPGDCRLRVFRALDSGLYESTSAREMARELGIGRQTASKYMREWEDAQAAKGGTGLPETITDARGVERPRRAVRESARTVVRADNAVSPLTSSGSADNEEPLEPLAFDEEPDDEEQLDPTEDEASDEQGPATPVPMPKIATPLRAIASSLRAVRLRARKELPEELNALRQDVERGIKTIESKLRLTEPIACPHCTGAGCQRCAHRGWLSREAAGVR